MTYKSTLPGVFPWVLKGAPPWVAALTAALMSPSRNDVEQGSSFAVTVDNWDGTWNLWLSQASRNYLKATIKTLEEPTPTR